MCKLRTGKQIDILSSKWSILRRGMKPTTRTRTRAQNPLPEFFEVAAEVQTTINSSLFEL